MYDGDEGGNETLPPVVDEEVPDETIPPETDETASEEPVQPEGDASVDVQATSQIIASETTTAYSYIYASGKLLQEKVTTNGTTETHNFFYDNTGKPYAMQVNGTTYYYVTNLQGDVMGMVDSAGNTVASYTYDPYGKLLTATGELADKNPLRYRGYYYDKESGFYYLQSRYYDPATRRFVNADAYASTGQGILGINMFAYCNNDPANSSDPSGHNAIVGPSLGGDAYCLLDGSWGGSLEGIAIAIGAVSLWDTISRVFQTVKSWFIHEKSSNIEDNSRDNVDWASDKPDRNHIIHGTRKKHDAGWRRMGIDPNGPNAWNLILPLLQKVVEEGLQESGYEPAGTGYTIKYVMDFAEYGVRLVVKIWYDTIGGTGVISDAIPYCK